MLANQDQKKKERKKKEGDEEGGGRRGNVASDPGTSWGLDFSSEREGEGKKNPEKKKRKSERYVVHSPA